MAIPGRNVKAHSTILYHVFQMLSTSKVVQCLKVYNRITFFVIFMQRSKNASRQITSV